MKSLALETTHSIPSVLRGDRAVGVLPDDRVSLLGAQHVHRLGAVGGDAELGARRVDVLPDGRARTRRGR